MYIHIHTNLTYNYSTTTNTHPYWATDGYRLTPGWNGWLSVLASCILLMIYVCCDILRFSISTRLKVSCYK